MVSKGAGATFAIKEISGTIDTVYLTDVQGEVFKKGEFDGKHRSKYKKLEVTN